MWALKLKRKPSRSRAGTHGQINPLNAYIPSTGNLEAVRAAQTATNQSALGTQPQWSPNQSDASPAGQWSPQNQGTYPRPNGPSYDNRAMSPHGGQTLTHEQLADPIYATASTTPRKPLANAQTTQPLIDVTEGQDNESPFGDHAGQQEGGGESMLAQSLSVDGGPKANPELTLEKIVGHILQAGQKFEELQDIDRNDPEHSVQFVLQAYDDLAAKNKKKKRLGKSEKGDTDFWKKQFEQKSKDAATLSYKCEALEEDKRRLKREKEELKRDMRMQRETKEGEIIQLTSKLKAKKDELESTIRNHSNYVKELNKAHQAKVNGMKGETARAVQTAQDKAFAAKIVQEQSHKEEVERLKNEKVREAERLKSEKTREIARIQTESQMKIAEHRSLFDGETQRLRQEKEAQEARAEEDRIRLETKAAAEKIEILRREEALKGALLSRDHFKGLADSALVSRFSSLAVKLEGISNIEWNGGLRSTWPFTEDQLERFSKNDRKLKQQMLLNTLWFALNELIFATPFRILGEDGQPLDEGWFRGFEGRPQWPHPTEESEKSRYETAKTCLSAVQNKGEMNGQQINRQESYKESVRRIVEDVSDSIGRVALITLTDQRRLEDLVATAGALWLEVCSQKYRLRVVLPEEAEDVMMRDNNDCQPLKLISKPGLLRFGNSQGQDLTKEEYVGSWKGQTIDYRPI